MRFWITLNCRSIPDSSLRASCTHHETWFQNPAGELNAVNTTVALMSDHPTQDVCLLCIAKCDLLMARDLLAVSARTARGRDAKAATCCSIRSLSSARHTQRYAGTC